MGKLLSRKLAVTILTVAIVALNKAFGLSLSEEEVLALVGLAVSYLVAQGWVDGREGAKNEKPAEWPVVRPDGSTTTHGSVR